jgi:proteasome lid subunit RPN8/RPN11
LISARDGEPVRLYPVPNISPTPERLFEMDPKAQIDAMRRMRDAGEALFAIYHSHPRGPATPSAEDLAQAAYPEALYLIVSLQAPESAQLRAFWLRGGQAEPVELQI